MTAHASIPALSGSNGDFRACADPIDSQFLQLLINPTSLSQHRSPPAHRGCFSLPLCVVLGQFWRIALGTLISNLPYDSARFGTPLGHPSCVALRTTTPLPHSLQDCVASIWLYLASHILGSKQPVTKSLSAAACLFLCGTPALVHCLLGKVPLWDPSPPSPGWEPFAHEISLFCSTRAAGPGMRELRCP